MSRTRARALAVALLALCLNACGGAGENRKLDAAEPLFADYLDAAGALDTIDSGVLREFAGAGRDTWAARHEQSEAALRTALEGIDEDGLSPPGRRGLSSMRSALALRAAGPSGLAPNCLDAGRSDATGPALREALYACFGSVGDVIVFEGRTHARVGALGLLEELDTSARRRALFEAMGPLYRAINGGNEPDSPYRRMIGLEVARMRANIASAEASLGVEPGEGAAWLARACAWRVE